MLQAKQFLQCPFIFHAGDSIILDSKIPEPTRNWVAGYRSNDSTNYSSFDTYADNVIKFHKKGAIDFDYLHVGVIGIYDYKNYWNFLERALRRDRGNVDTNDISGIELMLQNNFNFSVVEFREWLDIGNTTSLLEARAQLPNKFPILSKHTESISFVDDTVIKFFSDSDICKARVERAAILKDHVPNVMGVSKHFFSYKFEKGTPLSEINTPEIVTKLLYWAENNLWLPSDTQSDFLSLCDTFYRAKTKVRLQEFYESRNIRDSESQINNESVPPLNEFLDSAIDIAVEKSKPVRIHGDFVLDNIILNHEGVFKLIDWRQDFAGDKNVGDIYYDLAKLNHSLYINHRRVNENLYKIAIEKNSITCEIFVPKPNVDMKANFDYWIAKSGFDYNKVQILTSLVWLNMAALHHHPFDLFLFFYGKLSLWRSLNVF
jgi:hypothetical protein